MHLRHDASGPAEEVTESAPAPARTRTGRNLPVAIGVGVLLGGLAVLTLFTVKATFLLYVGAIVAAALWELSRALGSRGIYLPLIPVVVDATARPWSRWPTGSGSGSRCPRSR